MCQHDSIFFIDPHRYPCRSINLLPSKRFAWPAQPIVTWTGCDGLVSVQQQGKFVTSQPHLSPSLLCISSPLLSDSERSFLAMGPPCPGRCYSLSTGVPNKAKRSTFGMHASCRGVSSLQLSVNRPCPLSVRRIPAPGHNYGFTGRSLKNARVALPRFHAGGTRARRGG